MNPSLRTGFAWVLAALIAGAESCIGLIDKNDHDTGLIVSEYPTHAPADKWACYVPSVFDWQRKLPVNNLIITTDSALDAYFNYNQYSPPPQNAPDFSCRNYQPEPVDFTKYTLLGNYADGSCNVAFSRSVLYDRTTNRYVYVVNVRQAGSCKVLKYSMNWVLVPKLAAGSTVVFQVK